MRRKMITWVNPMGVKVRIYNSSHGNWEVLTLLADGEKFTTVGWDINENKAIKSANNCAGYTWSAWVDNVDGKIKSCTEYRKPGQEFISRQDAEKKAGEEFILKANELIKKVKEQI